MMFRRCKVRHMFWLDEFRYAWVPTERAIVDAEIDLQFLPHVEEWPAERAS